MLSEFPYINGVEGLGRGDTKDCLWGHRDDDLSGQYRNSSDRSIYMLSML